MSRTQPTGAITPEPLRPHELRGQPLRRTMFLVTLAWFFGAFWMSSTAGTPLTNYAKGLGASNFQFGVLAALPFLASLLQLPSTLLIERTGKRKIIFLTGLYFQRLMWIPIALVPLWIFRSRGEGGHALATSVFLSLVFLMHCGQSIGGPGWMGWMSDLIPPGIRGVYFSRRRQWGLLSSIPAAWGAGWLLDHFAQTNDASVILTWCAVVFLIACLFGTLDIFTFHWVPNVPTEPKTGSDLLRAWGEPLRNRSYLHFAGFVGTMVLAFGPMGNFVTLYILEQLGAGSATGRTAGLNQITQLMLLVAPSVAQLFVFHIWGKAADRMGKRPILVLAALGLVPVGIGWCFVTASNIWLGYVLAALGGALWAGIDVANFNIVLEFSGSGSKGGARGGTAYTAVNSVIISIAGCIGGFLWGFIAETCKGMHWQVPLIGDFRFFHVLFVLSGLLRLVAVVAFLPFLHEPEAKPTVEALRYMTSNVYNNLYNAMMQPLRLVGIGNAEEEAGPEAVKEAHDQTGAGK